MSDNDLIKVDKADLKLAKYTTMLRVKYGYTYDQARKEIGKHMAEYEADGKNGAPEQAALPTISKHR